MRAVTAELPPINSLAVEETRQGTEKCLAIENDIADISHAGDTTVPGPDSDVPVRVYEPTGTGPRPLIVWMHGGGFVLGDIESYDPTCRALCDVLDAVIVSVDYRRAPEHRFPAAVEDCYATTEWAAESAGRLGTDPEGVIVAGDSAGGNLAASVAQLARDKGGPAIQHQAWFIRRRLFNSISIRRASRTRSSSLPNRTSSGPGKTTSAMNSTG